MNTLSVKGFGIAFGVISAAYVFLLGIAAALWGWGTDMVDVMSSFYVGYSPTFAGSVIGAIYGFIDGFIIGAVVAWVYNKAA